MMYVNLPTHLQYIHGLDIFIHSLSAKQFYKIWQTSKRFPRGHKKGIILVGYSFTKYVDVVYLFTNEMHQARQYATP